MGAGRATITSPPQRGEVLERQAANHGVDVVARLLHQCVHCHDGQLGALFGVEDDEVVDHLLLENVRGVGRQDHLGEEPRDVDPESHVGDDSLQHVALTSRIALHVGVRKQCSELIYLACGSAAQSDALLRVGLRDSYVTSPFLWSTK